MATSPRDELRIIAITEFRRSENDGQWYWTTKAANGEKVGSSAGEGYKELRKAVAGFFAQQGIEPSTLHKLPPEWQHYSKLIKVTDHEHHIRRYAYGAPEPYER
jgi:uncharacterized protein YegP (UPF0339 family)